MASPCFSTQGSLVTEASMLDKTIKLFLTVMNYHWACAHLVCPTPGGYPDNRRVRVICFSLTVPRGAFCQHSCANSILHELGTRTQTTHPQLTGLGTAAT